MGRPRKLTKAELEEGIRGYFGSISRTVTVTVRVPTGRKDEFGHDIMTDAEVRNDAGELIRKREYLVPPTIGGLCRYLGISYSTWERYAAGKTTAETAEEALDRCREWLEEELLTRKNPRGVIFQLENNYGKSERHTVEMGERTENIRLTMDEREEILRKLAGEMGN